MTQLHDKALRRVLLVAVGAMTLVWAGVGALGAGAAPAPGASGGPGAAPGPVAARGPSGPAANDPLRLSLMDNSMIVGQLVTKELNVDTLYGTLKIPMTDVLSFTPGLDSHPQFQQKLATLIEKLASSDFTEREGAQKELTALGPSIRPELEKYVKDPDPEKRNRVQLILEDFAQRSDDSSDDGDAPAETVIALDTVRTRAFTVTGKINPRTFEFSSAYGNLTIKIGDIRKLERTIDVKEEVHRNLTVDCTTVPSSRYKPTGIRLEKGDQVTVTASGNVTLTNWGSNAVVGPDGSANYAWFTEGDIPIGCLVGRIGTGQVMKVGGKLTFTADRAGAFELAVGIPPAYASRNFPGKFDVKIVVKPKQ